MWQKDLVDQGEVLNGSNSRIKFELVNDLLFCGWEFSGKELLLRAYSFPGDRGETCIRSTEGYNLSLKGRGGGSRGRCKSWCTWKFCDHLLEGSMSGAS